MSKSKPLNVLGMLVILGALVFLIYHYYQKPAFIVAQTQYPPVPCSQSDKIYKVYKTYQGKFCLEKQSKDWIKNLLKKGWIWEKHVVQSILRFSRKGSTVVDIGAHIGTHTVSMSKAVGEKGTVIAFEPQIKIYQELLVNLELNQLTNVRANLTALGSRFGYIKMDAPKLGNEGSVGFSIGLPKSGNIVELRTLDSYNLNNVSLIKMDVEGVEDMVLAGAKKTILRNKPVILIEITGHTTDIPVDKSNTKELVRRELLSRKKKKGTIQFLKNLGYLLPLKRGYDYVAIHKDSKFLSLIKKQFSQKNSKNKKNHPTTSQVPSPRNK